MIDRPLNALYVFRERKRPLLEAWRAGREPDTLLFGLNHLHVHGVEASFHEPDYGVTGKRLAALAGRLGPDMLQLRALQRFRGQDVVLLTAGWPLLLARRFLRHPPRLIWLNLSLTTLLASGTDAIARFRARVLRAAVRQADSVVCVARGQQAWLVRELGFQAAKLPFVPSGVDAAFYTPVSPLAHVRSGSEERPHDAGYVLAVGRDPGRDYVALAQAAIGLDRQVEIVAHESNVAEITLPANVTVTLRLPPLQLRERYRGAACVVVPTHGDGYPHGSDCSGTLVMLDALATQKPVVITRRSSVTDYVTPGEHVLTVPAGDADALRSAIQNALRDITGSAAMAAAGRRLVLDRFTTRTFASQIADVFRTAVETRR